MKRKKIEKKITLSRTTIANLDLGTIIPVKAGMQQIGTSEIESCYFVSCNNLATCALDTECCNTASVGCFPPPDSCGEIVGSCTYA